MSSRVTRRRFLDNAVAGGAVLTACPAARGQTRQERERLENEAPQELIMNLLNGYRLSQMVYVAAKLGVADQLEDGPRTVQEVAAAVGAHPDSLYRLLRALAGLGVFAEEEGMRFRLTPAAGLLRKGAAGSRRATALVMGDEGNWRPWGDLLHSVRTGETAFVHLYGKSDFDWYKDHPEEARAFDEFQAEGTRRAADSIAGAYDFSRAGRIVDVGGGSGALLSAILRRYPQPRGVLFDLDHVVQAARTSLDPRVAARCEFAGGDFFKAVPAGGDVYVMKYIIHDWDDARSRSILGNVRKAMRPGANLLLIEQFVCRPNRFCAAKINDVNMLVRTGGRNRTEKEYRDLLASSGFRPGRALPAPEGLSLLEAD